MPQIQDEAICVRHWDFSETSQTVSLLCRELGVLRGLAKGAKRERGRFSGGIALLTRGEIMAITKRGRDLATLTEWDLHEIFPALARSLHAHYAGLYAADLVHHFIQESDPHPHVFDGLVSLLRDLPETSVPIDDLSIGWPVLRFQWVLLHETGYVPELEVDVESREPIQIGPRSTVGFKATAGGVVTDSGGGSDHWRVRGPTIALLRRVSSSIHENGSMNTEMPPLEDTDATTVSRANRLLAAYIRAILDRELPTMRTLFGEMRV